MDSFEQELNLMSKYALSYNELALIKLIFYTKESDENYSLVNKYYNECLHESLKREDLINLQNKKVLDKEDLPEKGKPIYLEDLTFRKSFLSNFYKESHILGKELWEEFPFYIVTSRQNYPIKNFSKRFRDLDELFCFYGKAIRHDMEKHKNIIKSLKFAKENNLISCNIVDYLIGHQWEEHIKMMNGEVTDVRMNFDPTELM